MDNKDGSLYASSADKVLIDVPCSGIGIIREPNQMECKLRKFKRINSTKEKLWKMHGNI